MNPLPEPSHNSAWPARIPAVHPQTAFTRVDGQVVVVLADCGEMLVFNPVGARLWELCDGRRSVSELAAALHAGFDVSMEQARSDTLVFIEQLVRAGALVWLESPAA